MHAWFAIELDTTGPQIEVYAQSWVAVNNQLYVTVEYDDVIDEGWYISRLVDSRGNSHDIVLQNIDGLLIGSLQILSIPPGTSTLEVRLRDTVHNLSNLVRKQIEILPSSVLNLELDNYVSPIKLDATCVEMELDAITRPLSLSAVRCDIACDARTAPVQLKEVGINK